MDKNTFTKNFIRPRMGRRLLALTAALTAMGACIAMFKAVGFGTDPCSTFTLGLSSRLGVPFGICQMVFNMLLFIPVLFCDLSRVGVGTIGNMMGLGYVADFFMAVIDRFLPEGGLTMPVRVLLFAVTMVVFLVAVSLYMAADLGVSPFDALPQLIAARVKRVRFRAVRMIWDLTALILGWLLGSTVGLTTVITGFCLGPAIEFVTDRVKGWFE